MTYKEFIDKIVFDRGHHDNFNHKISGFEIHHIVPRCMGGSNASDNLVLLTTAEHLIAHILLFRENMDNKELRFALYLMSNEIGTHKLLEAVDNQEEFKLFVNDICRVRELHDIKGKNNPMYHKHHSKKAREAMSEKKKIMYVGEGNPHWAKQHTEETKKRISETRMGKDNWMAKKVYCVELDRVFDTIREAMNYVGIKSGITQCCNPKYKRETAGRHPVTKERLHWAYIE